MRLLISHFHNEEYLLPWWISHHKEMFDTVVMINHRSTDRSCEIIRKLAPHWEIVDTTTTKFSAKECDAEVMYHEGRFQADLKIVLNTTEFLICESMHTLERLLNHRHKRQLILSGAIMVDQDPEKEPQETDSLVSKKHHGIWETNIWFSLIPSQLGFLKSPSRSRIIHCSQNGIYQAGRHFSKLPEKIGVDRSIAAIWWYALSPFNAQTLKRKQQIAGQIPPVDKVNKQGFQHLVSTDTIVDQHLYFRGKASALSLTAMTTTEKSLAWVRAFATRVTDLESHKFFLRRLRKWIFLRVRNLFIR